MHKIIIWIIIGDKTANLWQLMKQETTPTYLWPEEFHNSDLAVHAYLLDRPKSLCCHHIDLQPCVLGYEQIEVLCWGEVTCGYTFLLVDGMSLSVNINEKDIRLFHKNSLISLTPFNTGHTCMQTYKLLYRKSRRHNNGIDKLHF